MDNFTGRVAVVTGGGSGMGRELVRQLAAEGCAVATCDLDPEALADTAALSTGAKVSTFIADSKACGPRSMSLLSPAL